MRESRLSRRDWDLMYNYHNRYIEEKGIESIERHPKGRKRRGENALSKQWIFYSMKWCREKLTDRKTKKRAVYRKYGILRKALNQEFKNIIKFQQEIQK